MSLIPMGEGTELAREGSTLMRHSVMMTLSIIEGHSYTKTLWTKRSLLKERKAIIKVHPQLVDDKEND